jgi:3-methyladenine DNA glycosylase AlkD
VDTDTKTQTELVAKLQQGIESKADPETQAWWETYLKQTIPFRGTRMADIRASLHAWFEQEAIGESLPVDSQKELALSLMRERYAEDKLSGILFLQEILLPAGGISWREDLPRFAALFHDGHIDEWNTCDWFCVKVLGPLAQREGEQCARAISAWRDAENLWQRRASGVAFVNLAKQSDECFPGFTDMLLETCGATVRHPERFAQTGTGWVLRELSLAEPERVASFVKTNLHHFSSEALRTATAKLSADTQARLRIMYKARVPSRQRVQRRR